MYRRSEYEHQDSGDNVLDDINVGFNNGVNYGSSILLMETIVMFKDKRTKRKI